jgi:subtilisin family serine protease
MLKKTPAVLFAVLGFFIAGAQHKFSAALIKELHTGKDTLITCLVKGDVSTMQREIASFSGKLNYFAGNIASVTLPLTQVRPMAAHGYVQRMELMRQRLRVLDDSALRKNNILKIHSGAVPLAQAYTGKGVLLGIIDTGTDIHHADFKDSLGNSRIAWLWDQRFPQAANTPQPYNYGQEWSGAQIDAGLSAHDDYVEMSHGTKVAGVAAGNGASAGMYKGIAPEVGIISVAVDFNNPGPTITDALNYIISKANALGKPLVVNLSIGDYLGSHDGKDLQAQMIDNMMNNLPGRALVVAAGNGGDIPFHLGYPVSSTDTNFTWLKNPTATIDFQVYADSLNFKNVKFTIGAHNGSLAYRGNIGFLTVDSMPGAIRTDTLKFNGNRMGIIKTISDYSDSVYTLNVNIEADSLNYLWTFETTGSGRIDSWSFDYVYNNLPSPAAFPAISSYKRTDTLQTICSSFQCGRQVITVGNYTGRTTFIDVNGAISSFNGTDSDIFPTSSFGPTRDGRIRPDITATGENIATTGALPILDWLIANFPFAVTQDSLHMTFGGTSAAAPVVAGLAALYFEKYPTATLQQLKQDIINCSLQDGFTQSVPNNRWGFGKLDGFATLTCRYDTRLSENQAHSETFRIYPNPASDWLTVESPDPGIVSVHDVSGRQIQCARVRNKKETIPVGHLANGLYFITLHHTQGGGFTQAFIKAD